MRHCAKPVCNCCIRLLVSFVIISRLRKQSYWSHITRNWEYNRKEKEREVEAESELIKSKNLLTTSQIVIFYRSLKKLLTTFLLLSAFSVVDISFGLASWDTMSPSVAATNLKLNSYQKVTKLKINNHEIQKVGLHIMKQFRRNNISRFQIYFE